MKKYSGNSGLVEQIPEPIFIPPPPPPHFEEPEEILEIPMPRPPAPPHNRERRSPHQHTHQGSLPSGGFFGGKKPPGQSPFGNLGGFLNSITKEPLETEDYLMLAVLYLLYRESGDIEFLIIAGIMLLS